MPCPYFQPSESSSSGVWCRKIANYPLSSTVRDYCTTGSWTLCPNYTGSSCFLTTACVHYAGLPDDCEELTGMRNFRDAYLLSLPNGQAMYDEYYRLAPAIVEAIERSDERSRYRQVTAVYFLTLPDRVLSSQFPIDCTAN